MTSTKRIKVENPNLNRDLEILSNQLDNHFHQIEEKLKRYKEMTGKDYPLSIKDGSDYDYVNPQHYVQEDGRQTWEHMVDEFGLYETAIFCKLNAYKYADRMGKKPNEDIDREQKKIDWYNAKAAELFEKSEAMNNDKNWGFLETD